MIVDALRDRMGSEWTLSWLAHWMLYVVGWGLSGRWSMDALHDRMGSE